MAQLIEYTKHTDRYLLHHFVFEANDGIQFNGFHGNFSLNKYMSLNDWQTIYESLRNDIASYAQQSHLRPESKEIILNSINVRLNVSWTELDHDLYQRLVPNLNMNQVYAFVMCVSIAVNSNVVEFSSSVRQMTKVSLATRNGMPVIINVNESEVRAEAMCALSEAKSVLSEAENVLPPMRKCRVLLPKLKSMNGMPVTQKLSMSSTPLTGNASTIMAPMGNDLSVISSELDPHQTNGSCNETQTGKRMSRKRLFDEITETPANKVLRSTRKKRKIRLSPSQHLKSARKVRRKVIDKSMKKVQTVKKERKVRAKQKVNKKIVEIDPDPEPEPEAEPEPEPEPETIQESIVDSDLVLVHDLDKKSPKPHQEKERSLAESPIELNLETMNIEDILATFESSRDILTGLFNNYLKQTDEVVRPADDYKPLDVMSTITHDQFGAMADVLYENFIPVGDINCGALFFELLLPEWVLAILMDKLTLTRKAVIERIQQYSQSKQNQSHSTIIRLDDTSYLENTSQLQ